MTIDTSDVSIAVTEVALGERVTLLVHEDPRAPRIAVHVLLSPGAAADPPGRSGLAHLAEHLAFSGSPHAPGDTYDRLVFDAGGTDNAWTDHDHVALRAALPSGNEELALFLESDRLLGLAFEPAALVTQRAVVARERDEGRGARTAGWETLASLLWPEGHPYRRPVNGDDAALAAITADDVRAWWAVATGRVVVSLAGDLATDFVVERARAWFADLPSAGPPPPVAVAPPPLAAPVRAWTWGDVDRPDLLVAWRLPARTHPDRPALEVAAELLARDPLLRSALGDGASVDVSAWSGASGGRWLVEVRTLGRVRAAMRAIHAAVARLRAHPPGEGHLAAARVRARAAWLRALQDVETRAETLSMCHVTWGEGDCVGRELRARDALRPDDVSDAAARWLAPTSSVSLVVVPRSAGAPRLPGFRQLP